MIRTVISFHPNESALFSPEECLPVNKSMFRCVLPIIPESFIKLKPKLTGYSHLINHTFDSRTK